MARGHTRPSGASVLRDFEISSLDHFLHATMMAVADSSLASLIRSARIELRADQPARRWKVDGQLLNIIDASIFAASQDDIKDRLRDAISCIQDKLTIAALESKWNHRAQPLPNDPLVDISPFRTGRAITEEEEELFAAQIEADSPLEIVIRGHLWIESRLISMLAEAVPAPAYLDKARTTFASRLYIVAALGLLPDQYVPPIVALNKIRNKVAHELNAAIGPAEEDAFVASLGPELGRGIDLPQHRDQPFPGRLRVGITILLLGIDAMQDQRRAANLYENYLSSLVSERLRRK